MKNMLCLLPLTALLAASPASAQRIEGFALTYDQLPSKLREPIPLGREDFDVRLAEGGRWEITGDVILAPASRQLNKKFVLALDTLDLSKGGRIITNGHTLVIAVNTLKVGSGQIVAFTERDVPAGADATTPGGHGERGASGASGGAVSIHVVQKLEGLLDVDLSGQNGGNGGAGAKGMIGSQGPDGRRGVSGEFDCKRGGENGKDGRRGRPGGRGGDGGSAGSGGVLFVYTIGQRVSDAQYRFVSNPGKVGQGGAGGPGGDGGRGGRRGGGAGYCKGGKKDGARGPVGSEGPRGTAGEEGAPGIVVAEALSLQVLIEKAGGS